MRIQGKLRGGYFPLPLAEARRIRACLRYPASPFSAIDPCIGDAGAFWLRLASERTALAGGGKIVEHYRRFQDDLLVSHSIVRRPCRLNLLSIGNR